VADVVPLITPLILDRPLCLECIARNAGITLREAVAALEEIADALHVYREADRCRACGEMTEVLSVRRGASQTDRHDNVMRW
jgi:hypothetical protein